ncbi:adenylate kinase family protein [Thermodesulfobacteriota bacterium]
MNIIVIGPSGCGKRTQTRLLIERFGLTGINVEEVLKEEKRKNGPIGIEIKGFLNKGLPIPEDVVFQVIEERLKRPDCRNGLVMSDFPGTVDQAKAIERILKNLDLKLDHVVSIEIGRDEVIKRLSGRRICPKCNDEYHIIFNPPTNEGMCNKCNSELYKREDDQGDTVSAKYEQYQEISVPLMKYYKRKGILKNIDGSNSADQVSEKIAYALTEASG